MDSVYQLISKAIDGYICEQIEYEYIKSMRGTSKNLYTAIQAMIDYNSTPIDNHEHMWYNKFNKWSWNKFENGVIINERLGN